MFNGTYYYDNFILIIVNSFHHLKLQQTNYYVFAQKINKKGNFTKVIENPYKNDTFHNKNSSSYLLEMNELSD